MLNRSWARSPVDSERMILPMPGWTLADIPFFAALPIFLLASAFFSGSETAIFGMRPHEVALLRQSRTRSARAAVALARQPRMLLITLLLGNMLVNILYFVISSVLLLRLDLEQISPIWPAVLGVASLLIVVLTAEIGPKLFASSNSLRWVLICSIPLLILHDLILPIRAGIATFFLEPLLRLVGSSHASEAIDFQEVSEFLELARRRGELSFDEQSFIWDVVELRRRKVRDAMTPRVRMKALSTEGLNRKVIEEAARDSHDRYLVLYDGALDQIVSVLDLQYFLLARSATFEEASMTPSYIPETATLDRLLEQFRERGIKFAVAVDEYGQTAGLVTIDDVFDELLGDQAESGDGSDDRIMLTGMGRWRVSADLGIYDFAEAFGIEIEEPNVSTVGGFILESLGRLPEPGDQVAIGRWRLTVEEVDGTCAVTVIAEATE